MIDGCCLVSEPCPAYIRAEDTRGWGPQVSSVFPFTILGFKVLPEVVFFNINLTKDSSILLHAFHSPFYRRILKKTIFFLQKIRETRKSE